METLLVIVVILFWAFMLGLCASAAWDSARLNQGFRYLLYLVGVVVSADMVIFLIVKGL